jgi:cytochrome c-type biogenesis protein
VTPLAVISADPAGLSVAFAAGVVAFASPCVWPLVPAYLSYVSGVAFADLEQDRRRVVTATAAFVLGFGVVFTLAGAGVGVVGGSFLAHRRTLEILGGVVVVLMGLVLVGAAGTGFAQREWRLQLRSQPAGLVGAFVAGLAFAVGWSPCIGPTLAGILTVASESGHAADGAGLLAAYSLGLGLPFLLFGLFFTQALGSFRALRRHMPTVMRAAGALLIVTGVLLATGELTTITSRLSNYAVNV